MAEKVERRLAAILAADVVGFSRLMAADEAGTLARLQSLRREAIEPAIGSHGGRIVKLMGDGTLVEFASVNDAVRCAATIQRSVAERAKDVPEDQRIELRIGVNAGDVIVDGDDIYGDGVNIAARLEQMADPGGICISGDAYRQARGKVEVGFEDLGDLTVKNIPEPVRSYRVLLDPDTAGEPPTRGAWLAERKQRRRWMMAGAAAAIAVIGAVVGALFALEPWVERVEAASETEMALPLPDEPSVVVLPFETVGADESKAYIAQGLTEGIVAHLSAWPNLFVIDIESSYAYVGKQVTVKETAEALGVRYVLRGSVQPAAEELRITTQLIDALSGRTEWSERYDRAAIDILALQDDITRNVSIALQGEFASGEGSPEVLTYIGDNLEAWEHFYHGKHLINRWDPQTLADDFEAAQVAFRKAIEIDGEQPAFLDMLGWAHLLSGEFGRGDLEAGWRAAEELGQRAVEIAPSYSGGHLLLGRIAIINGRREESIALAEKAVALTSNAANPLVTLAMYLNNIDGTADRAIALVEKAIRLSPNYPSWYLSVLGEAQLYGGYHQASLETHAELVRIGGGWTEAWPHLMMAHNHWMLDEEEEARASLARFLELQPDFSLSGFRAFATIAHEAAQIDRIMAEWDWMGLPETPPLPLPDRPSIAVLPFDNLNEPDQDWFADGMTDDLITDLSKISGLFVIGRNTVFTYRGKAIDIKQVGRELGVRHVLEGSVRRAGDTIRINAQLIDASTGGHVWAEKYDGAEADAFALQDNVISKIVASLAVQLTAEEEVDLGRLPTTNMKAYEHYRRGIDALDTGGWTPGGVATALAEFEQALSLDPEFTEAYVADAAAAENAWGTWKGWTLPAKAARERAEASARKALDLDPGNPSALGVISLINASDGDYDTAIKTMRAVAEENPNSVEAHAWLASVLSRSGDHTDVLDAIGVRLRLDPDPAPTQRLAIGLAYFHARDYRSAAEMFEASLAVQPDDPAALTYLAATWAKIGRLELAKPAVERAIELFPMNNVQIWAQIYSSLLRKPDDRAHYLDGLRKAGLPEWPFGSAGTIKDRLSSDELRRLMSPGIEMVGTVEFGAGPLSYSERLGSEMRYEFEMPSPYPLDPGTYELVDDVICYTSDVHWMGRPQCGHVYRNHNGSNEDTYAYLQILPGGIKHFSVRNSDQEQ